MKAFRVLLFSDTHFSVDSRIEEEKWFPPICSFLEKIGNPFGFLEKFLSFWDRVTQKAFSCILEKAEDTGRFNLAIGLGDYTPGTNESGLVSIKSKSEHMLFRRKLKSHIRCPEKLVWGDHDNGYSFFVKKRTGIKIGTEKGGLSKTSVEEAKKIIGQPFGSFDVGYARFVFIATNLIRNVDEASESFLLELKYDQENFLARTLHETENKKIFILLHDPTALVSESAVRKILDSHSRKITAIIHGHLHASFSAFFARLFSPVYRGLCGRYKMILVPASWGMMGIGGGFKVMSIYDNGAYSLEKYGK